METPKLIEPGVKYFIQSTLKRCRENKHTYFSFLFNIICFISFISFLICFLIYKYKGKLSPLEKEEKLKQQKYYIFSKIKQFQSMQSNNLITNLPKWNNI